MIDSKDSQSMPPQGVRHRSVSGFLLDAIGSPDASNSKTVNLN